MEVCTRRNASGNAAAVSARQRNIHFARQSTNSLAFITNFVLILIQICNEYINETKIHTLESKRKGGRYLSATDSQPENQVAENPYSVKKGIKRFSL
jgi:hypothetical protein